MLILINHRAEKYQCKCMSDPGEIRIRFVRALVEN